MNIRGIVTGAAILGTAVGAWADCGFCGSGGQPGAPGHESMHAAIGKPAPDFALTDLDGRQYKLSDAKGKVVVLEWMNHECPFVKRTHGKDTVVNKLVAKFQGRPVVWLGVNSSHFAESKADEIHRWVKDNEISYPVLLDADGTVGHLYEAKTTPHVFVIDQQGMLAYAGALDNDSFGKEPKVHNYVDEAVTALLNGSTVATSTTPPYGCSVKYRK